MNHTVKCKYCSEVYEYTQYNDERGMVERHQSCPRCGHTANFVYGTGLDNTAWYEDALKYRSQKNEWISVEDRLPEQGQNVKIKFQHDNKEWDNCKNEWFVDETVTRTSHQLWTYRPDKNYMYPWETVGVDGTVIRQSTVYATHWQPLPEPPKE